MGADVEPSRALERVGILGAGTMGSGIAQIVAEAGIEAVVHDPIEGAYRRAHERIAGFLARKVEKGQLDAAAAAAALDRLNPAASVEELAAVDLVVEAIPEELELKRDAFRRLDAAAEPETVLATNTSSLSVARIASATGHPERVVGMHFFNPVPLMALVEVVPGPRTAPDVAEAAVSAARRLGKTPVVAADTPGFIVNRVARPFYLEAMRMAADGAAGIEAIDAAARGMGFRMGPFELVDTIGADVNLAVSLSVYEAFGRDPRYEPQEMQEVLVSAGRLGRKTSGGFYDYAPDGSRGNPWSGLPTGSAAPGAGLSDAQIAERLLATIVNEAASAVADGVAAPESIDVAMRLGANYPSGPLEWGERVGLATAVRTLDALAVASPDGRYRVVPLLRSLAEGGGSFFAKRP
ncbi:MAG TPA: 3-hydroxyacyl-CoA dehydrogenase NAD-binding domain-containing protein [Candidatus Limnocylindria bacterium]|nr:3-hydroxyacyl-CoA dehydrogenase NAD-binding domain-containing protein [Candidatus Limnocylindria bacterium]